MNKRIISLLFSLILILASALPAFASSEYGFIVDDAGLLTDSEFTDLEELCEEITDRQEMEVVIMTAESLDGEYATDLANHIFQDLGYGYGDSHDAVCLLVDMGSRDWAIERLGYAETVFTDDGVDYIAEQFKPYLADGEYYTAFETFANLCDEFITQANTGEPYDSSNLPKEPFNFFMSILIALGVGIVIALIVVLVMKSQLKSVRSQPAAANYIKAGSMNLTASHEQFLYRHVDRVKKAESSGSSGNSNSGSARGGSF